MISPSENPRSNEFIRYYMVCFHHFMALRRDMLDSLLCRLKRLRDRQRDALPILSFGFELALSGFGQAVILGPAVVLRFPPVGSQPSRLLHAVQGGKKRARFDLENALCD